MKRVGTWDQQVVRGRYYRDVQNPAGNLTMGPQVKPAATTMKWPGIKNKK